MKYIIIICLIKYIYAQNNVISRLLQRNSLLTQPNTNIKFDESISTNSSSVVCNKDAGEVWTLNGPCLPQTCEFLNQECKTYGKMGCFCSPGYVRDGNNICVEGNIFCGLCGKNEYYTAMGSQCQTECSTLGENCVPEQWGFIKGCYCNNGYARNAAGVCIPIDECTTSILNCMKTSVTQSVLSCDGTCNTPFPSCYKNNSFGCFCNQKFVNHNGRCIRYNQCPTHECGQHEIYMKCGIIESTCNNAYITTATECQPSGCYCEKDYVRDSTGKCIPYKSCSEESVCETPGESWSNVGVCELKCNGNQSCPTDANKADCYCTANGYAVDEQGYCIKFEECPNVCIEEGTIWSDEIFCEEQCDGSELCAREMDYWITGCMCVKDGYVRDENGDCILKKDCII